VADAHVALEADTGQEQDTAMQVTVGTINNISDVIMTGFPLHNTLKAPSAER
jgi:hypothetical protein